MGLNMRIKCQHSLLQCIHTHMLVAAVDAFLDSHCPTNIRMSCQAALWLVLLRPPEMNHWWISEMFFKVFGTLSGVSDEQNMFKVLDSLHSCWWYWQDHLFVYCHLTLLSHSVTLPSVFASLLRSLGDVGSKWLRPWPAMWGTCLEGRSPGDWKSRVFQTNLSLN